MHYYALLLRCNLYAILMRSTLLHFTLLDIYFSIYIA